MSFEEFWALYPRRVAKLEAAKAWKQMTRDYDPADILAGLRRNLPALSRKDKQYLKHPASWLRAGCWMDEPEQPSRPMNYAEAARKIFDEPAGVFGTRNHDEQLLDGPRRH